MKKVFQVGLTVLLCFLANMTFAQNREVSGTVIFADDQQPLIGVSVFEKGTTIGTVTEFGSNS